MNTPLPRTEPAWTYWRPMGEWPFASAISLLLNLEPREGLGYRIVAELLPSKSISGPSALDVSNRPAAFRRLVAGPTNRAFLCEADAQTVIEAAEIRDIALSCAAELKLDTWNGSNPDVRPLIWLQWVRRSLPHITMPEELTKMLAALEAPAPPSREELEQQIQQLHCQVAQLEQQASELQAELQRAWVKFDPDEATYPPDLMIAFQAWRAVTGSDGDGTPSQRLNRWIATKHPDLKPDAVERIAAVANWDKGRGRKSSRK